MDFFGAAHGGGGRFGCWRQHFFARNQQILLHQKIQV